MKHLLPQTIWNTLTASLILLALTGCGGRAALTPQPAATAVRMNTPPATIPSLTPTPQESPAAAATPALTLSPPRCAESTGQIETRALSSPALARPLAYHLYLPPCYDPHRTAGYPVVLLLHGQSMTGAVWEDLGFPEAADRLIEEGEAPPFVMVMPREDFFLQEFKESEFDNALLENLLPALAEQENLSAQRECRAIGGISRGASWAIVLGLTTGEEFGAIGAHSVPSAPFSGSRLRTLRDALPPGGLPRLRLDIGQSDRYFKGARYLHTLLEQLEIPHEWEIEAGAHNADYWRSHAEEYLRWYAAGWDNCWGEPDQD